MASPRDQFSVHFFFIVYITDIIESSSLLNFILFADDTNIFYSHKCIDTLIETLNHELTKVSVWFKCNKQSQNIDKTCFINFSKCHSHTFLNKNIIIDNVPIIEKKFFSIIIYHGMIFFFKGEVQ